MLWLALYFPRLAVEIHPPCAPAVAVDKDRVHAADAAAEAAGIVPGMRLSAALGLAPTLSVLARDEARERAALHELACWAGGFTPHVSVLTPAALLLEIGGCLRLFGGLASLHARIQESCAHLGWSLQSAVAPTPLAAYWLALAGETVRVAQAEELPRMLARLSVEALGPDAQALQRLASFGVRSVGDLLALPRDGLAHRFGPQLPLALARALGEMPDPQPWFAFPERFAQRIELMAPVANTQALLFVARRLVAALAGWLATRAAGVSACELVLEHADGIADTRVVLGMAGLTRNADRIERVLRERMERLQLVAPVEYIGLQAASPEDLPGTTDSLFGEVAADALAPLIERLRARLGEDKVGGLAVVADHRPECATALQALGRKTAAGLGQGARPLCLLDKLVSLPEIDGRPCRDGPLQLLAGPERIESGWWDAGEEHGKARGDVRRDYFVALTRRGEWLWIFRDRQGWFWQGVFA